MHWHGSSWRAHKGEQGSTEQDLDEQVVKLLQHQLPEGRTHLFVELVGAVLSAELGHLRVAETLGQIGLERLEHLLSRLGPRSRLGVAVWQSIMASGRQSAESKVRPRSWLAIMHTAAGRPLAIEALSAGGLTVNPLRPAALAITDGAVRRV